MRKMRLLLFALFAIATMQAQEKETPNAKQARRLFMEIYNKVYGEEGATLHYKVNIIGIYKTEGTIWMKQKKSKFIDEKYIAWNDDVTFHRLERKKKRIVIYDAHSEERDKYAAKFKFTPDNYTYSIKDEKNKGIAITLKAKKGVKGIKEAQALLKRQSYEPIRVRIKIAFIWTTIKISDFQSGGITDEMLMFPEEQYKDYKFVDKR